MLVPTREERSSWFCPSDSEHYISKASTLIFGFHGKTGENYVFDLHIFMNCPDLVEYRKPLTTSGFLKQPASWIWASLLLTMKVDLLY